MCVTSTTSRRRSRAKDASTKGLRGGAMPPLFSLLLRSGTGEMNTIVLSHYIVAAIVIIFGTYCMMVRPWVSRCRQTELSLPSTFFMPYCVCPSCTAEDLHWMEKPDWERMTKIFKTIQQQSIYGRALEITPEEKAWLNIDPRNTDVIRTCRKCANIWGQKVGIECLLKD